MQRCLIALSRQTATQVLLREEFARQTEALRMMALRGRDDGGGIGPHGGVRDRARLALERIRQRLSDTNMYIKAALGPPGGGDGGGGLRTAVAEVGAEDSLDHFIVSTHLVPRRCGAFSRSVCLFGDNVGEQIHARGRWSADRNMLGYTLMICIRSGRNVKRS